VSLATLPSECTHIGELLKMIFPVTPEEVDKIIMSIPAKSSPLDFKPTSLLKDIHFTFSDIIARLANLSFTEGVFPNSYKSAIVTPILKKPNLDRDDPVNYRPTSNLNNIPKLLEHLYAYLSRFLSHVCASHNCRSVQSAYRPHYSTETALLHTMDSVFRSSDQGQPSLLVSLDMSAAFDTIDHSILLNRLLVGFGVYGGSALTWLQSYFTDRYQCVRDARQSLLSDCLSALHSWFCHNGLALNSSKSESILIGTRQRLCTSRSG